jgi:hypothetical protein
LAVSAANLWAELPWVPEAMYLGTVAAAAVLTSHRLLWSCPRRTTQLRPALALAAASVGLMFACLALDALLCARVGPWLGATPLLFLGSLLGFAALVDLAARGALYPAAPLKAD